MTRGELVNSLLDRHRPRGPSFRELKLLEAVQFLLDATLQAHAPAVADPAPFLHQQFLLLTIRLQVDGGDDVVADENRQGEIAELPLFLWNVGFETVLVAKK